MMSPFHAILLLLLVLSSFDSGNTKAPPSCHNKRCSKSGKKAPDLCGTECLCIETYNRLNQRSYKCVERGIP
uniref:Putative secreted protein n=1 Tax=Ornithodoros turicata TaxID=34597 RepID=A0A2R5LF57_9ACAR